MNQIRLTVGVKVRANFSGGGPEYEGMCRGLAPPRRYTVKNEREGALRHPSVEYLMVQMSRNSSGLLHGVARSPR